MSHLQTTVPGPLDELDLPEYIVLNTPGAHTNEYPFCMDPTCPCRKDCNHIANIVFAICDGLLTVEEGYRYMRGQTI